FSRKSRRNQVVLQCKQYQLCVIFEIERFHDVVFVEHDSFLADLENAGDFLHGTSFGEQLQHLLLARSQILCRLPSSCLSDSPVFWTELGRHIGLTFEHAGDCRQQFRCCSTLEDIPHGPQIQSCSCKVGIILHGQENDLGSGKELFQALCRIQTVQQ